MIKSSSSSGTGEEFMKAQFIFSIIVHELYVGLDLSVRLKIL